MSKKCIYKYYTPKGELSDKYYLNESKYGTAVAEAIFIKENIQYNSDIKYSSKSDEKLFTKYDYKTLGKKGYSGITSMFNTDDNTQTQIINNVAINLKIGDKFNRSEAIDYFKYDKTTLTADDNKAEFEALRADATRLNELHVHKGDLTHKLFELIFEEKNKLKKEDSKKFELYYNKALRRYKQYVANNSKYNKNNTLNNEVLSSLKIIARDIILKKADELNQMYLGEDFQLHPEISLFTDKVLYSGKPRQGHIDLMLYSAKSKLAYVLDYKTKSEQSYLNFDNAYGYLPKPFNNLAASAENKTAIQTSAYALMLQHEYGIKTIGRGVLLVTSKHSHNGALPGKRIWKVNSVNHVNTELKELEPLDGALDNIFDINKELNVETNISADKLITDIFDGKLVTVPSSKENFINRQEGQIKKLDNGKYKWFNIYDHTKSVVKNTKKETLDGIGEVYEDLLVLRRQAAPHLVDFFNTDKIERTSIWNQNRFKKNATNLLNRFDKETHTLESSKNIPGLPEDIIVATNNFTGEVILMSLTVAIDADYNFNIDEEEDTRTTIFGPFITDNTVNKKHAKGLIPKATMNNLNKLRLAALAAELKVLDSKKYGKVTNLLSVALLEEDMYDTYQYSLVKTQMGYWKEIASLMKDNSQTIPMDLALIVNDDNLSGAKAFDVDYFEVFSDNIRYGRDPLKTMISSSTGLNAYSAKKLRSEIKKSIDIYEQDRYNLTLNDNITKQLVNYVQTVYGALLLEHKSKDTVFKDERFISANRALLAFKKMMVLENPDYKTHILGQINSLTTVGNDLAQSLHLSITEYEQRSRDEIIEVFTEHTKLQKELFDATPDVNTFDSVFSKNNFKKIFGPMLLDGYDFNKDNVGKWMRFKHPDQLTGIHKKYVIFYNKMVKKAAGDLFSETSKKLMYPSTKSERYDIPKWDDGSIPILHSNASVDLGEFSLSKHGMEASLAMIKKIVNRNKKSIAKKDVDDMKPWEFSTFFPEQVDSSPGRGSRDTRSLLNITNDNGIITDKRDIELNPAVILNIMMVEAARKKFMTLSSFVHFSLDAELAYKKSYAGVDTTALRKLMSSTAQIRIHSKVDDDGKAGQVLDALKNIVSVGMFWGSARQTVTEVGTATVQLTSQSIANIINKNLFKGTNKYDNKDLLWSAKLASSVLGNQIIADLGMYNTSLGVFTGDEFVESKRKLAYQTKWGFWAIQKTLQESFQSVILAQMHKEGIKENAYTLDKKTGKYHYDETLDKSRFYVYDEKNPIPGQEPTKPMSEEDKTKHRLWKAHRKQMALEGGINSNNKMTRPFIIEQLQTMKSQAIRLFGALDNSEAMGVETAALGRAAGAYKRWILQKINNYWSPAHKSFKEGVWGIDEHGDTTYIKHNFEGILQSIGGIITDLKEHGSFAAAGKAQSDMRKRNLAKLLADLLLTVLIYQAIMKLAESDFADTQLGNELIRGLQNAHSDIMPFLAVTNTLTGSPLAAVSIAINTATSLKRAIGYLITGDLDNAIQAADKTMDIVGVYRAGKSFSELLIGYDNKKNKKK